MLNSKEFIIILYAFLIIYYSIKNSRSRENIITLFSLCFCMYISENLYSFINYLIIGLVLTIIPIIHNRLGDNGKKYLIRASSIFAVVVLVYYKYMNFIIENVNRLLKKEIQISVKNKSNVPIGISYFTLTIISYYFDLAMKTI